jgi:hypothetical protein
VTTTTTTESPSPYAPGKLPDEPAVARPAGRAIVFLWAIAASAIAGPGVLWRPWTLTMMREHLHDGWFSAFTELGAVLPLGAPLLAYLCDRVPVLGTRREGHLLLASLVSAGAWLLAAFGPRSEGLWLATTIAFGVATVMATAATKGALAEIGQRRGATGRLAAADLAITSAAGFAITPLVGSLYDRPLAWTGGVGAGLALSVVLAVVFLSQAQEGTGSQPPAEPAPRQRTGLRAFPGRRTFWVAAAMVTLAEASRLGVWMPRELSPLQTLEALAKARLFDTVSAIAALAAYALVCRRARPRILMPLCLLAAAAGRAAFGAAGGSPLGAVAGGLGGGLGYAAIGDLALRVCPRGREAFGYMLLMLPRPLLPAVLPALLLGGGGAVQATTAVASGALVLAAAMVALLPREVLAAPDRPPPDRAA